MEVDVKRIVFALFAFALSLCALSVGAAAQSNPNCVATQQYCPGCGDPGIGFFNCVNEGSFLDVCQVMTPACPPPAAAGEVCLACLAAAAAAGRPINLAIGNTFIEETDVRLPGLSGGLMLKRTWNSMWPATQSNFQIGLFGPNWRSTFEERVFLGSDYYIKYARGDGSFWSFGSNGSAWSVAAPANVVATLVTGNTSWTLTFQNGEQRVFDGNSGKLTTIIDRNGNTTQLSYDSSGRLVTVTDPVSRHLYFAYAGAGYLVTSVTSDVGLSLSYSYDTQGRLSQVTNPDLSTLSFTYNTQSLISSVTDSNGKILESHTYDSNGRGLTSSRANGVDAVTITYPN
jgi:YD repeat-containing protein